MGSPRFYLAGRVAVEGARLVDQAELPGRQGRLALAKLVVERHRPVPTDELAASLWEDGAPASVESSLRALVSKLRAGIEAADPQGAVVITADAGCYQLRAPTAWVDLEAAANAIDRAEGALRGSDLQRAWSSATVAAGIAARPFLPGEDARWIAEVQGRLRAVRIRALTVLSDVHCQRGDHQLAVGHARALVALEPFREAGHRALMAAHLAAGDRGEAVRAYETCRRLLAEQLGVDPSSKTEQVYLRALQET